MVCLWHFSYPIQSPRRDSQNGELNLSTDRRAPDSIFRSINTTKKGEKKLIKKECTFELALPNEKTVQVKGELLVGRPELRTKMSPLKKRV